jgi:TLC domain
LSTAFQATLTGRHWDGSSTIVCGVDEGRAMTTATSFYLNPFFHDQNINANGGCAGSDWMVIGILMVLTLMVSWGTRWLLFEPFANWRMQGVKHWNKNECQRFSMTCSSCWNFVMSAVFAHRILSDKPWLFVREQWMELGPYIDADFKFYYLWYAARFLSDIVSLWFESRQRDALIAAFIHHVTTLGLVLGSAYAGLTRHGGTIMFFFDWADIPLLCAKACKYLSKDPRDFCQTLANRLFEIFAVLFFATRCVYFNYVVYATWMDLSSDWAHRFCKYLLLILVVLQTYWMSLIVKAVVRMSKNGGIAEDARDTDLRKKNQ